MNKNKLWQSIILGIILVLTLSLPGCKPGNTGKKKDIMSARPTPADTDHYQGKGIRPRKAKFSRKWED